MITPEIQSSLQTLRSMAESVLLSYVAFKISSVDFGENSKSTAMVKNLLMMSEVQRVDAIRRALDSCFSENQIEEVAGALVDVKSDPLHFELSRIVEACRYAERLSNI